MRDIVRLLRRAPKHHGALVIGLLAGIATSLFTPLTAEIATRVMRELEGVKGLYAQGLLGRRFALFAAGIVGLAIIKGLLTFASRFFLSRAAQATLADLRQDLYANLVERPLGFLSRHHASEFVSRVTNDVQRIEAGLTLRLTELAVHIPETILCVAYLWYRDAMLAFCVTVLLPIAGLLVRRWSKKIKTASRKSQEHTASLANVLGETLGGIRIVKAFVGEKREAARFAAVNETLRRSNMRAYRTMALSGPVLDVLGAVVFAVLIGLAATEIAHGRLKSETFVAFVVGLIGLYRHMKKATTAYTELQNTTAAARRCFDILDDDQVEPGGRLQIAGLQRDIELRGVTFSYGGADVLSDVDLRLTKGEVVALVGESGAGKTTVTNLLLRFHDVSSGCVLWDGVDLREISPRSLRAQVALVTQDVVVFDDTVARNIAYGDSEPDMARVEAAAEAAHADLFVRELEDGYLTKLGQGGNRLSGGQRQRIAIARAIYKDAPLLILDEATSSLDSHSEALVQDALARLMRGRTVLVVAHRLATIRSADRIVVMASGRIVQEGSHAALLEQDGTYRQLHLLQSR